MIVVFTHNEPGRGATYRADQLLSRFPGDERILHYIGSPDANSHIDTDGRTERIYSPSRLSGPLRAGWSLAEGRWRLNDSLERARHGGDDVSLVVAFDGRPNVQYPARALARELRAWLHVDIGDYFWWGGAARLRSPRWASRAFEPLEHVLANAAVRSADSITTVSPELSHRVSSLRSDIEPLMVLNGADISDLPPDFGDAESTQRPVRLIAGGSTGYDLDWIRRVAEEIDRSGANIEIWMTGKESDRMSGIDCVHQLGFLDDGEYAATMARADFALAPSSPTLANEGRCPGRIPSFWGSGLPVLATDVGPWRDLIRDANLGMLLPADPDEFARAVVGVARPWPLTDRQRIWAVAADRYDWRALAREFAVALDRIPASATP